MDFGLNEKSWIDIYINSNFKSLWPDSFDLFAAYLQDELSNCLGLVEYLNSNKKISEIRPPHCWKVTLVSPTQQPNNVM
jgi:hypothetical protein